MASAKVLLCETYLRVVENVTWTKNVSVGLRNNKKYKNCIVYNDNNKVITWRREIFCKNYKHNVNFCSLHDFLLLYSILIYSFPLLHYHSTEISVHNFHPSFPRPTPRSFVFRFWIALRISSSLFHLVFTTFFYFVDGGRVKGLP